MAARRQRHDPGIGDEPARGAAPAVASSVSGGGHGRIGRLLVGIRCRGSGSVVVSVIRGGGM